MRPARYWAVAQAYNDAQRDRLIYEGDLFRQLGAIIINLLSKKKVKRLRDVWRMAWDDEKTTQFDTNSIKGEERQRQIEKLLKMAGNGISEDTVKD